MEIAVSARDGTDDVALDAESLRKFLESKRDRGAGRHPVTTVTAM